MKPTVILATRGAARIARRRPDALVIDYSRQCIRRGTQRVDLSTGVGPSQLFRFCAALCCAIGGRVWRHDLIAALWADDPDGGPLWVDSILSKLVSHARPFLAWAGLTIRSVKCPGRIEIAVAERPTLAVSSFRISFHGLWPSEAAA